MKNTLRIVIGSLLLTACGGSSRSGVTIEGAVGATGSAAAGLQVSARGRGTLTDSSGQFSLKGVPAGSVSLRLQGDGLDDQLDLGGLIDGMQVTLTVSVTAGHAKLEHEEGEFVGRIDSIALPDLVVSGVTVHTNSSTEVEQGDKDLALTDLKVGEEVRVEGVVGSDHSITASEIEVLPAENEVEVEGVVRSVDKEHSSLQVAVGASKPGEAPVAERLVTVKVNSSTRIFRGDDRIQLKDVQPGDRVHVRGTLQAGGSVLARVIRVAPGFHARVDLVGVIDSIDKTNSKLVVSGLTVVVDAQTRIVIGDHQGTLADLTVGETVHVLGTPPGDGTILARLIIVRPPPGPPPPPEVELKGTVSAVDTASTPHNLTVDHIKVNIDADTRFGGDAHSLADIHVGDFVGVAGTENADGSVEARVVVKIGPSPP